MSRIVSRRQGRVRFWRLRRNPLRRRSYLVEAWLLFATAILAVVAAVCAGMSTARAVEHDLDGQRAERHAVPAVVTRDPARSLDVDGTDGDRVWAHVRWTAADGATRTGVARVEAGSKAGSATQVWLDEQGGLVPEPVTAGEAELQGAVMGATAALCAGAAVILGGCLARARLDRGRQELWETEWALIDPKWGRRTG